MATESGIVYGLVDPNTQRVRYIGQTSRPLRDRVAGHLCDAKRRGHTHVARWLASLAAKGQKPTVATLAICAPIDTLGDMEREIIGIFRSAGASLTNATDGGDGGAPGFKHRPETLLKFKDRPKSFLGKRHTEETKRLISERQRARLATSAIGARMSAVRKGRSHSAEARRRMSASQSALWSAERRAAHSATLRASAAAIEGWKTSAAKLRGRKRSPAAVAATAAACRKPIVDQHGRVYASHTEAATALGVTLANIGHVLAGRRPHTRGFTFKPYNHGMSTR